MKTRRFALPALVLAMFSASAWADCSAPSTQSEMTQCAGQAYSTADKKLNVAYNEYRARLNAEQKKKLTQAQLAWVKFRDLSCAFESSGAEGGSAYPMVRSGWSFSPAGAGWRRSLPIRRPSRCSRSSM